MEWALERNLPGQDGVKQRISGRVRESSPGVLDVDIPVTSVRSAESAMGSLISTVTEIWRLQPDAPDLLEVKVHPFHVARDFASARWLGRRQGQTFRWERSTPWGPQIQVQAFWFVCDRNREHVKDQVLRLLHDTGFRHSDQIGWFGSKECNSRVLIRADSFQPDTLLNQLDHGNIQLELRLYQGPGKDFPGDPSLPLPGWQQCLRDWQWRAQSNRLTRRELVEEGMMVDLGWPALELDSAPR